MLKSWDDRRDYIIAPDATAFAVEHWLNSAKRAIQQRGRFNVALSGGSTPKAIYAALSTQTLPWDKVHLFFSDERAVPPDHPDSNYHMAMTHLSHLPIPASQIHRMVAEKNIEQNARDYAEKIERLLGKHLFDLVMLGVGEDGHTASLFPNTSALTATTLVAANYVPDKKTHRLTLTYPCINQSAHIAIYATGASKHLIVPKVLEAAIDSPYPASRIGTPEHKALWILDKEASQLL